MLAVISVGTLSITKITHENHEVIKGKDDNVAPPAIAPLFKCHTFILLGHPLGVNVR